MRSVYHHRKQSMHYQKPMHYEWECLGTKKLQEVIQMCLEDSQLPNHKQFFCNLNDSVLQLILLTVFTYKDKGNEKERFRFSMLISMLKTGTGFIDFLASGRSINVSTILSILDQQEPDEIALNIFGEVFTSLARTEPNKLIKIIEREEVQSFMIKNMRHRQMYKVLYTTVFCLNLKTFKEENQFVSLVICSLLLTLFEDENQNSFFELKYWHQPEKCQLPDQLPTNQQIAPSMLLEDHLYAEKLCSRVQHMGYFATKDELCQNIVEMLQELYKNVDYIGLWNFEMLLDIMLSQEYIPKLFSFLELHSQSALQVLSRKLSDSESLKASFINFEENAFQLIFLIIELYQSLEPSQSSKKMAPNESSDKLLSSVEDLFKDKNIYILPQRRSLETTESLQTIAYQGKKDKSSVYLTIKHKFVHIMSGVWTSMFCLNFRDLQKAQEHSSQTSGLVVRCAGFKRFWILKIFLELLSNRTEDMEVHAAELMIDLLIDCLNVNKWNNIIQNVVVELFRLLINNHYQLLLAVNINKDISTNILGHLLINFRNRYHVFLKTMNMSHQGNRHTVFQISKHLINKMSQQGDLCTITALHPEWKKFIEEDIRKYEAILERESIFSRQSLLVDQELKELDSEHDQTDSLGAIGCNEIDQKWSLKTSSLNRKRKQSLLVDSSLWSSDSLRKI